MSCCTSIPPSGSIVVTSNRSFEQWGEILGGAMVAAALIDRLVHHATVVTLKGKSYRLRERGAGVVRWDTEVMRRAIAPLFALSVFAFVLFSGALLAAIGRLVSDGDPAPAPWQWWAFVALLGVNLVLLVGGTLLRALRQRGRRR